MVVVFCSHGVWNQGLGRLTLHDFSLHNNKLSKKTNFQQDDFICHVEYNVSIPTNM